MVNYMARNHIENIEHLKKFSCDGYNYSEKNSDKKKLVFVKSLVSEKVKKDFVCNIDMLNKVYFFIFLIFVLYLFL